MMSPEAKTTSDEPLLRKLVHQSFLVAGRILDYDEGVVLYHSWRVALLSEALARVFGIDDPDALFIAGLLHDIGAVRLTDHIVHQATLQTVTPGAVSHVVEGQRFIESIPITADLSPLIAAHHERVDGMGYPAGLQGEDIPIEASIIHLADFLDVSLRSQEPARRLNDARRIIHQLSGKAVFPSVAQAAQSLLDSDPGILDRVFELSLLARTVKEPTRCLCASERWSPVELTTILTWTLGRLADAKHEAMADHSLRVGYYATRIARNVQGLDVSFWEVLWAALLHDLGMASIPRSLIRRAGPLTGNEVSLLRQHAALTRELVTWVEPIAHLAASASGHHEHYDGTGYPEGRSGEEIPLLARILAYADAFDALTSNRPYRLAMPMQRALDELRRVAGSQLDPALSKPAIEALQASGPIDGPLPTTVSDYMALCETGRFEVTASQGRHSSARLRPVGHPVVLLPSEPWATVRIDERGSLVESPGSLEKILGFSPNGNSVQDWFDEQGKAWIAAALQDATTQTATSYLFTRKNRPLEVLFLASENGKTLLMRSAASRIDATKDLAVFYRSFLQSTQPTIFLDRHGLIRETNRSFLNLAGITLKQALGRRPADILLSDKDQGIWPGVDAALRNVNLGSWSGNIEIQTSQGPLPVLLTAMAVRDSAGVDVGYMVTVQDRSSEVAQERRMSLLNSALLSLGGDYDRNKNVLAEALAAALGAQHAYFCHRTDAGFELQASHVQDHPDPASRDLTWCPGVLERAQSDLLRVSPEISGSQGSDRAFQTRICHVIRMENAPVGLLCAAFRKRRWLSSLESHFFGTLAGALARQIQLEETHGALRRREEQYRLLTEHAGDIIWSVDARGILFYVNPAVEDILGIPRLSIMGRKVFEFVPLELLLQARESLLEKAPTQISDAFDPTDPRQVWKDLWKIATKSSGAPVQVEIALRDQQGQSRFLDVAARAVAGPQGGIVLHGIARDATNRKLKEQDLEQRVNQAEEMNRLKSELIASTSHDLKSPVNAILSYLNLMEDQIDEMDGPGIRRYLGRMRDAADRLLRLISDVMDLEKIEAGVYSWQPEHLDLVQVAKTLAALHETSAAERDIRIHVLASQTPIEIQADPQAVERILSNLLSNAIKYSPPHGTVRLSLSATIRNLARLTVEDEGPGIPPRDMERIFERFYQATAPQTPVASGPSSGLGLAIVRKLTELNMGRVWAEQASSGGARFVVELPTGNILSQPRQALVVADQQRASTVRAFLEQADVSVRIIPPQAPLEEILGRTRPLMVFIDTNADVHRDWTSVADRLGEGTVLVFLGQETTPLPRNALLLSDPILEEEMVQIVRRANLEENSR